MVYSYLRKLELYSKEEQIRILNLWEKKHSVHIDEYVWDDETKQKDTFKKRHIGLYLLPKLKEGDVLIVPEISCIGRSAIELQEVFSTFLIVKKIRFICFSMNLDMDFRTLSTSESRFIDQLSFAAKLQKTIVHETTKAALATRKARGYKLGAASEEYKRNYEAKSEEVKRAERMKRGTTINRNTMESINTKTMLRIIKRVFPLAAQSEDPSEWDWENINTKDGVYEVIYTLMKESKLKDSSGVMFKKWNFDTMTDKRKKQQRIGGYLLSLKKTIFTHSKKMLDEKELSNSCVSECEKEKVINFTHKRRNNINESEKRVFSLDTVFSQKTEPNDLQGSRHLVEDALDEEKLGRIEMETEHSQDLLSKIFAETESEEDELESLPDSIMEIMKILFTKDIWTHKEVEDICHRWNLMIGYVLEQINEYSYHVIEDVVLDEDEDNIYVITEHKKDLL